MVKGLLKLSFAYETACYALRSPSAWGKGHFRNFLSSVTLSNYNISFSLNSFFCTQGQLRCFMRSRACHREVIWRCKFIALPLVFPGLLPGSLEACVLAWISSIFRQIVHFVIKASRFTEPLIHPMCSGICCPAWVPSSFLRSLLGVVGYSDHTTWASVSSNKRDSSEYLWYFDYSHIKLVFCSSDYLLNYTKA